MNLTWAIYWIETAQRVLNLTVFLQISSGILFIVLIAFGFFADEMTRVTKYLKWFALIFAICAIPGIFLPDSRTMYAMLAANVGQKVVESPEMKEIGGKALKILNDKLDELAGEKEGDRK